MYKEHLSFIQIRLTKTQWEEFLFVSGYLLGGLGRSRRLEDNEMRHRFLKILDIMNEGNEKWVPYTLGDDKNSQDGKDGKA